MKCISKVQIENVTRAQANVPIERTRARANTIASNLVGDLSVSLLFLVIVSFSRFLCLLACPACGRMKNGDNNCCGKGGSWHGKCGGPGDTKFEHTWGEGKKACSEMATPKPGKPVNGCSLDSVVERKLLLKITERKEHLPLKTITFLT